VFVTVRGTPFSGQVQALLVNIRLGWKRLIVKNVVAYYDIEIITAVKCFIVQAPTL
jgi:hypothetical protein